mgnify:CR=1 FL=1
MHTLSNEISARARRLCVHATDHQTCPIGLLDFALDQIQEALYLIGENAHFVQVNDKACEMLGYSHEELLTMSLFDIDPHLS